MNFKNYFFILLITFFPFLSMEQMEKKGTKHSGPVIESLEQSLVKKAKIEQEAKQQIELQRFLQETRGIKRSLSSPDVSLEPILQKAKAIVGQEAREQTPILKSYEEMPQELWEFLDI